MFTGNWSGRACDGRNWGDEVRHTAAEIRKPIFIVGSGRSGTTILYNLLALHPELCWFSHLTDRFPEFPQLAVLHRVFGAPLIGNSMKRQLVKRTRPSIRPSEAGNIYHSYCGFENSRRMTEDELTVEMEAKFKRLVEGHLKASGRPRFMSKQTANTQRIRTIHRMFPDAFYVHIIRDGRAVAASLSRVEWWKQIDIWWLGDKAARWEEMGREPLELCALHWQHDVEEILHSKHLFEDRYLEVRYEDLVHDPRNIVVKVAAFCGLSEFGELCEFIPEKLENMNYKWETQLTAAQRQVLQETIGDFLAQLGYEPGVRSASRP